MINWIFLCYRGPRQWKVTLTKANLEEIVQYINPKLSHSTSELPLPSIVQEVQSHMKVGGVKEGEISQVNEGSDKMRTLLAHTHLLDVMFLSTTKI